jgi:hypothetical protein
MGGVLCHGQRPSLLGKDVHGGVIRYNALLDDAGQPHGMGECCLPPEEAVGTLSPSWPCAGQPPQRRGRHGRAMPTHHGDHRHGKTP